MCSVWIAGVNAVTNQSEVNAAAVPARASTIAVVEVGQRAGTCSSPGALRRNDGRVRTKSARSTTAQIRESASACAAAGAWNSCASDGIAIVAAATTASIETVRAREELKLWVPCLR